MPQSPVGNVNKYHKSYDLRKARLAHAKKVPAAHQQAALAKLALWYAKPHDQRGAILTLPTGGGKTFTAVRFACGRPLADGYKVLWLAHTHHLLDQAWESFRDEVGTVAEPLNALDVRVVSGASHHNHMPQVKPTDDVLIATLQTIVHGFNERHAGLAAFLRAAGDKLFVVFDEAHHAPATSYRKLMQRLREKNPGMFLLGLTATPTYTDPRKMGWLADLFPRGIVFQESVANLQAAEVLAEHRFEQARTDFQPNFTDQDYAGWVDTNRDLPEKLITELANSHDRNQCVANAYANDRKKYGQTIIFVDRIAQCEQLCEMLKKRGVRAEAVYSQVDRTIGTAEERNRRPPDANAKALAEFRDGHLDVLINVRMLTEGTDVPKVSTVFITRQTTSQILMTQMVGRALRGPKFGGTATANIVLFIDDWKQRINWADFDQIVGGDADDGPDPTGERAAVQLISVDLIRRLAAQMDSGGNVADAPFRSYLPSGWYEVVYETRAAPDDEPDTVRSLVLAYEHDKPQLDRFIAELDAAARRPFEDESVQLADVRPWLEARAAELFADATERIGPSPANDLFRIARHMAQKDGAVPRFFPFADRDHHDLDAIAAKAVAAELAPAAIHRQLQAEYAKADRLWRLLYRRYEQFKMTFDGCINRLMLRPSPEPDDLPPDPESDPLPDTEPSERVKQQVKERDGYRCCWCGVGKSAWLQADHILPDYRGGGVEIDNLQTLCSVCNGTKRERERIDFRTTRTPLDAAPADLRTIKLPAANAADDPGTWERFLRRWVNFLYRCAAVEAVSVGGTTGFNGEWTVRLAAGNNAGWATPHLAALTRVVRKVIASAGHSPGPARIVLAGPTLALPAIERPSEPEKVVTLDALLVSIWEVERFRVRVCSRDGRKVRGNTARGIMPYPFKLPLSGEWTVSDWRSGRGQRALANFDGPDYAVHVLDASGASCSGRRKLRTLRDSY